MIEGAIIDKNARIGRNVRVTNETGIVDSEEMPTHVIRDGVVVIPKSMSLRDGSGDLIAGRRSTIDLRVGGATTCA